MLNNTAMLDRDLLRCFRPPRANPGPMHINVRTQISNGESRVDTSKHIRQMGDIQRECTAVAARPDYPPMPAPARRRQDG